MPVLLFLKRATWPDVGRELASELGLRGMPPGLADEWVLVLSARGVPHRLRRGPGGPRLLVPRSREREALRELRAYMAENPRTAAELEDLRPRAFSWGALPGVLWSLGVVTVFLTMTGAERSLGAFLLDWQGRGGGDTGLMASGQWWRAVTALTLHADVAHLMGNICLGGVFLLLLSGETGLGAAWFLTLVSGALGNVAKVWLQGPGHQFLGASTAVFGGLGVLAGVRLVRGGRGLSWRRALPVAAALMLLAFLGVGPEEESLRIDLTGHFLGFAVGCALGLAYAALRPEAPRGRLSPWLGATAAALVTWAWWLALAA